MVRGVPASAKLLALIIVIVTVTFMLAPLIVVIGASLSAGGYLVFPPQGLSLKWFGVVVASDAYLRAAILSLKVASTVTMVSLAIGTAAAVGLSRFRFPGTELLQALFLSPLILPTIIFGIGMLMMFSRYFDGPSIWALITGHVVITIPYVVRTVGAVMVGIDPATLEAASTMGARWWQRYLYVLLPQCGAGIAAGAFFAFNISFDDAVVAIFLRGPDTETLPIKIYTEVEFTTNPSVAAVATLLILITVCMIIAVERLLGLSILVQRRVQRRA
jgi:putative spermidine/putrescine transport system permease protein